MEFWRIYRLVKAKRWMILCLMLITLATVYIAKRVLDEQVQYQAVSVVLPSQKAMDPAGLYADNRNSTLSPTTDRFSRLAQFIQSIKSQTEDVVALTAESPVEQKREVVRALTNINVKGYSEAQLNQVLTNYHMPTDPALWIQRNLTSGEAQQIHDALTVAPYVENSINTTPGSSNPSGVLTDFIQIAVRTADPNLSQQLANLAAAKFINAYHDEGIREFQYELSTLKENRQKANQEVLLAGNALLDFKRKNNYPDLGAQGNAAITKLISLKGQRDAALVQMNVAQRSVSSLDSIAKAEGPSLVVMLDPQANPHAALLREQLADLRADLQAAQARYTPLNPIYIRAKAAVDAKQKEYEDFLKQPYRSASPNSTYFALKSQEDQAKAEAARAQAAIATLDTQIAAAQAETSRLPQAQKQLSQLQLAKDTADADAKAAADRYHYYVQTSQALDTGLITLTNAANYAAPDSSGPNLAALLIYAAILSLIVGIGVVVGLDYLDNTVQTIPDAEKLLGMPVSAVIPAMPPGDPRRMTRLIVSDPLSPIAESYRILRTDLLFTAEDKPFKSLMVATAKPGQGATTTLCNLAVALAQVGKRVILIDADLRRPKLHGYFNVPNDTGLTSLLRDECETEEALKVTDIDNLLILPSGPLPLNPSELLASQKMRTLHERLKPHTDFILVDSPSAIAFSDSAILSSFMDAVLMVIRAQEAPRGSEMQVKDMLNKARANVIGVVLNGVKPQLVDSYYYHAAYYPQVTTSNGHSHVLPPPSHGNGHTGNGHTKTLEHDLPVSTRTTVRDHAAQEDIESTVIMDDIVDVKPQTKSKFSLRSLFGTDHKEE